jgi:hypothetical protein
MPSDDEIEEQTDERGELEEGEQQEALDEQEELEEEAAAPPPRPARKRKGKRSRARHVVYDEPRERRWTTGHVAISLAIGLGIGFAVGYQSRARPDATAGRSDVVESPESPGLGPLAAPPAAPAGSGDRFGRPAGDQHFGHDHPPEPAPGAAPGPGAAAPPAAGDPDSFGRAPGSEHYGHNHP